jgi:hypothetical protein
VAREKNALKLRVFGEQCLGIFSSLEVFHLLLRFLFFVSKVEHARGMFCEPFLCVPKVGCERSLYFFVVDCITFKSVFSRKGVFQKGRLSFNQEYSTMKRESESMHVYVFLKGCPFYPCNLLSI